MKNVLVLVGVVLLASGVLLRAAPVAPPAAESSGPTSASGRGTISFGEHEDGDGVGTFVFDVKRRGRTTGALLFAAEDHHRYPDIIVRMEEINDAAFTERSVTFSGQATLHDEPVTVTASAFDGGTETSDRFAITCMNGNGEVVFEARGDVFIGDVVVGEEE